MQTCSEIVMPIGIGKNKTMFPADPFNLKEYMDSCENSYGVVPRPHWITTYYGGLVSLNKYSKLVRYLSFFSQFKFDLICLFFFFF